MNRITLLLGGNLGDREAILKSALSLINSTIGNVKHESPLIESKSWGFESNDAFLNQALIVESTFSPTEILSKTQEIELKLGRIRKENQWSSRLIDIDILFYNNIVLNLPNLSIPHKQIQNRHFTLFALNFVIPNYIHPVLKRTISSLLEICEDPIIAEVYNA